MVKLDRDLRKTDTPAVNRLMPLEHNNTKPMSNITQNAVDLVNQGRQSEVEIKAQRIINAIAMAQATIADLNKERAGQQDSLKALAKDEFNAESIFGTVPSTDSANKATILKVIGDMNKSNQDEVAEQGRDIIESINHIDASIAAQNKNIVELRDQLTKLAVEQVTVAAVLG